jgi:hypothetical protein
MNLIVRTVPKYDDGKIYYVRPVSYTGIHFSILAVNRDIITLE